MMDHARQLFRQGRTAEALAAARQAYEPANPRSELLLGVLCGVSGQAQEAERRLSAALLAGAGDASHWAMLAAVRATLRNPQGEAEALREALERTPDDGGLWLRLTSALLETGDRPAALDAALEAVRLDETPTARRIFAEAVQGTERTDPAPRALLKRALTETWVRSSRLHDAVVRMIHACALPIEKDDLLEALLRSVPIYDPELEAVLTATRRRCLLDGDGDPAFTALLAAQCDANEYCWWVTPEEDAALAALPAADPRRAMYEAASPAALLDIPVFTPIRAGVSQLVRTMYEENPYPRWLRAPIADPQPIERLLRAAFPVANVEPIPGRDVLVAGCGTGQHAIVAATRYEGVQVLAVDLSRASLSYATRRTAEAGIRNITYAQADLLELGVLGHRFDIVECAGTLQALRDPFEGLAVLVGLLKPGGVLKIALYSRIARRELIPAAQLAKQFEATPAGIRALRRAILEAPADDPVRAALSWPDFYSTSMVRDLLMHVQEHLSEISDIDRMIGDHGLRLLGFTLQPAVLSQYRREFPEDPGALNLDNMAKFEARHPKVFRAMYQFWSQKPIEG